MNNNITDILKDKATDSSTTLPLLPLRGISVFPGMLLNFDVERSVSIAALNAAMDDDQLIFLVAQRDIATDMPGEKDLYTVGTVCRVKQMLKVPNSSALRVLVEGVSRAVIVNIIAKNPYFVSEVYLVSDKVEGPSKRTEAVIRQCISLFDDYGQLSGAITPEMMINVIASTDPGYISDYIAQNVFLKLRQKQILLEELSPSRRINMLKRMLTDEVDILSIERDIEQETQSQMNKSQREYYLREQMKVIQSQLGEGEDSVQEQEDYREKILAVGFDKETEDKLLKELSRLAKQPFGSSEAAVMRTYLDTVLDLPWNTKTKEILDLDRTRKILDDDHYGLDKVKERILEFLAVKKLKPDFKGGVICLVGPPGTGKTSIAMSIARATGRKLARISLGGVHDEAEIRGHRKTYVGAMPGRIITAIQQAKSKNPVIVLDEIDKLAGDYRGDPSSALLEALDTEQNGTFRDNFLEIPFDLSDVLFITTANSTDTIPRPLLDRMELIELPSYTDEEKLRIAHDHLLPKQRKKHGLKGTQLKISDDAMREIIAKYTRESGVRTLEREIASICRKAASAIADEKCKSVNVRAGSLEELLGPAKFKPEPARLADEVGLVHGLAWTSVGGEVLDVEVGIMEGSGKLELTGNLGDVMKESAHAALSYIRSRASKLGIDGEFYKNKDIHIHFPEGAVPKDGPSAGITICMGIISALTGRPVRHDIAMTGEITLRGRILPIGGLREKTMAALRNDIHTVIIPADNESDLKEIDPLVRNALSFITTDHVDKVIDTVLLPEPSAISEAADGEKPYDIGVPATNAGHKSSVAIRQ